VQRGLDAYGPGIGGGGVAGIGARGTLSSDANARFNETPSSAAPGRGGRLQQRAAEINAQKQATAEERALRRDQIAATVAGQQLSANTSREVAAMNADRSIEAAGIGATASRDVARIGADARRSAAEQAALAQAGNAEARVAAAEAKANAPKFTAINLPDTLGPNGEVMRGGQVVINSQTGQRVGEPAQSGGKIAGDTRALAIRDNPKLSDSEKRAQLKALGYQ
jgi:hypothetical protein